MMISSLILARALDARQELVPAARAYEAAIREYPDDLELVLDLILIYFSLVDHGMVTHLGLSTEAVSGFSNRIHSLLEEAGTRFPQSTELAFWRHYIPWANLGHVLDEEAIRELLRRNDCLVPLIAESNLSAVMDKVILLCEDVMTMSTERQRYVLSVIHSRMRFGELREEFYRRYASMFPEADPPRF